MNHVLESLESASKRGKALNILECHPENEKNSQSLVWANLTSEICQDQSFSWPASPECLERVQCTKRLKKVEREVVGQAKGGGLGHPNTVSEGIMSCASFKHWYQKDRKGLDTIEINAGQSGHRGWGKIEQHGPLLKALDFLQTFFDYEQLHPRTMDSCTDFSDLPCRTVG